MRLKGSIMSNEHHGSSLSQGFIQFGTTHRYTPLGSDLGSGAKQDCTFFRPVPAAGYLFLGDYAQPYYDQLTTGFSDTVMPVTTDGDSPAVMPPLSWNLMWSQTVNKGGNKGTLAFWSPVAPDNFVALGWVITLAGDLSQPNIPGYGCVRSNWVVETKIGEAIWNDKGSGNSTDLTLYRIQGLPNAFVGQRDYEPYAGTVFKLNKIL